MTPTEAQSLTEAVATWVNGRADLRALGIAGSWSRGTARPDSDLDLFILANTPNQYQSDQRWLSQIVLPKPFSITSHRGIAYGVAWSCHALLEPAAELELTFAALDWASTDPLDAGTRGVVSDSFKVILDKDGLLHRLVEAVKKAV